MPSTLSLISSYPTPNLPAAPPALLSLNLSQMLPFLSASLSESSLARWASPVSTLLAGSPETSLPVVLRGKQERIPFYRWENCGSEKQSHLPKITQPQEASYHPFPVCLHVALGEGQASTDLPWDTLCVQSVPSSLRAMCLSSWCSLLLSVLSAFWRLIACRILGLHVGILGEIKSRNVHSSPGSISRLYFKINVLFGYGFRYIEKLQR